MAVESLAKTFFPFFFCGGGGVEVVKEKRKMEESSIQVDQMKLEGISLVKNQVLTHARTMAHDALPVSPKHSSKWL